MIIPIGLEKPMLSCKNNSITLKNHYYKGVTSNGGQASEMTFREILYLCEAMKLITLNIDTIKALCDKYHVKTLFAFGSVTKDELKPNSDIDLVVDIDSKDPLTYSDDYFGLKFQLEQLLKRHVDLLELRAIKNQYLKQNIDNSKVLVYGKGN
ncbi:MAG TPA: nucleotidyltransferase domain-containing protein [Bacteroidia bacterium]|nr:nucleotidyltransferase domain-containing protein [Bacteroidia bacterium]